MKKYILDLTVREALNVGKQFVLLRLISENPLPEMLPGQFVEVRVDETPSVLLRRPISIHYYDKKANELGLLVQLVGNGTRWMATLKAGDVLNVVLPLGNGFTLPADNTVRPLLVGGGVGVAPLLYLGMKLKEMIDAGKITKEQAVIGYVGAFPYAEVVSGYTSFFLGARSVCESATMAVKYTNSWFDIAKEKEAANALIADGCVLISQHADSEGAPKACEEAGVPNVAYNLDTREWGPNTALVSSKINWAPYFKHIITATMEGTAIEQDFCKGLKDDVVQILGLNETVAAEGTEAKLEEVKEKLINGEIKVFDTNTFTVGGKNLTEYMADVDSDAAFTPDTNVVSDGYFHESEMRSAPYFDILIDGITEK